MNKPERYSTIVYFTLAITALFAIFMSSIIFPKYTKEENDDLTIKTCGLFIDHLEVQQFEVNMETLETELVYFIEPVYFDDWEIKIENETAALLASKLFHDGEEIQVTFGEVKAIPRLGTLYSTVALYLVITMYFLPRLFRKSH